MSYTRTQFTAFYHNINNELKIVKQYKSQILKNIEYGLIYDRVENQETFWIHFHEIFLYYYNALEIYVDEYQKDKMRSPKHLENLYMLYSNYCDASFEFSELFNEFFILFQKLLKNNTKST